MLTRACAGRRTRVVPRSGDPGTRRCHRTGLLAFQMIALPAWHGRPRFETKIPSPRNHSVQALAATTQSRLVPPLAALSKILISSGLTMNCVLRALKMSSVRRPLWNGSGFSSTPQRSEKSLLVTYSSTVRRDSEKQRWRLSYLVNLEQNCRSRPVRH